MRALLFLFLVSLLNASYAEEPLKTPLPPEQEAEIEKKAKTYDRLLNLPYGLFPHKGTYVLPFTYNATPNQSMYRTIPRDADDRNNLDYNRKVEAEFQISFLLPIYRKILRTEWDIVTAYTHHAWWQLYNARWSRPFRETNYTPEIFARKTFQDPPGLGKFRLMNFDGGYMHHSNGQYGEMSRSWNRIFARSMIRYEDLWLATSLWYRVPESDAEDDNYTINKYYGIGEIDMYKNFGDHTVGIRTPIAWSYYSVELKYSYPWRGQWRWYTTLRSGYAMSLNDYNHETQRIGVGLILEDFVDK